MLNFGRVKDHHQNGRICWCTPGIPENLSNSWCLNSSFVHLPDLAIWAEHPINMAYGWLSPPFFVKSPPWNPKNQALEDDSQSSFLVKNGSSRKFLMLHTWLPNRLTTCFPFVAHLLVENPLNLRSWARWTSIENDMFHHLCNVLVAYQAPAVEMTRNSETLMLCYAWERRSWELWSSPEVILNLQILFDAKQNILHNSPKTTPCSNTHSFRAGSRKKQSTSIFAITSKPGSPDFQGSILDWGHHWSTRLNPTFTALPSSQCARTTKDTQQKWSIWMFGSDHQEV